MNKLQKLVVTALRESGFGPTHNKGGNRWVETTSNYAQLFEPAEDGSRPVSEKDFARVFVELQELGVLVSEETGAFVRLGDLGLKTENSEQPKKEKITVSQFDVKTAATSELIAKYNELNPDKPVKKFADRATAEKRVAAAMQALAKLAPAPAPVAKQPQRSPHAAQKVDRSGERYSRHGVSVAGVVYKSVADAFKKIGLPMSRHIPFRAKVKTEGQATFEHEGKSYVFKKVEQAKIAE